MDPNKLSGKLQSDLLILFFHTLVENVEFIVNVPAVRLYTDSACPLFIVSLSKHAWNIWDN